MTEHQITAAAYIVIGGVLEVLWVWLRIIGPHGLAQKVGPYLSDKGLDWLGRWFGAFMLGVQLFALFILACAADHIAHGRIQFLAEFEAAVSAFAAFVVLAVVWRWKR